MEKIKVLIVAGDMHVGGIENQLMHLMRNADRDKFQFDFTSTMKDAFYRKALEKQGGNFFIIPQMDWKNPVPYFRTMYQIMKRGEYHIVHAHELFHSGITLWIAKRAGVPCRFVHAHNWRDDDGTGKKRSIPRSIYNILMRKMINKYSTTQIACSTWAGEFLYGKKTMSKSTYHLVYNSVDSEKFLTEYGHKESGEFCDEGWTNVLNVARITVVKNQKFLIEIANEFRKADDRIRILIVGSGDQRYEKEVRSLINKDHLESYIQLLGVREDIDILMRKSDAFVLPSKYEGMPLVMIEAQASGLPCVSADTYSPEVDFGIGTVTWMSLDAGASKWAEAIRVSIKRGRPEKACIEKSIQEKKFDSKMFSDTICALYQQDYIKNVKALKAAK